MIEEPEIEPIKMLDWINEWQQKEIVKVDLIPLCFYEFMTVTEMIFVNDAMKWDYWDKAVNAVKSELNIAKSSCRTNNANIAYDEFEKMQGENKWTLSMKDRISNKAKKLILFDYFRKK